MKNFTLLLLFFCTSALHASQKVAPNFILPNIYTHESVSLDAQKGKVILVDFWASWCGPCQVSLPEYDLLRKDIHARYGVESFEVFAINVDVTEAEALIFLKSKSLSFPILRSNNGSTQQAYELIGLPSSFLIDQQGNIIVAHQGFEPGFQDHLRTEIDKLLVDTSTQIQPHKHR